MGTQLTAKIHSYLDTLGSKGRLEGFGDESNNNSVLNEKKKPAIKKGSRLDFFVTEEGIDSPGTRSFVAIVEVGTEHENWWGKNEQILEYVDFICTYDTSSTGTIIIDQPILLTVMTVTKNTTPRSTSAGSNASTRNKKKIKNCGAERIDERNVALDEFLEQKRQIQKTGFGNDTIQVRSAVFLCTLKGHFLRMKEIMLCWKAALPNSYETAFSLLQNMITTYVSRLDLGGR